MNTLNNQSIESEMDIDKIEEELWMWDEWNKAQTLFALEEMTQQEVGLYDKHK